MFSGRKTTTQFANGNLNAKYFWFHYNFRRLLWPSAAVSCLIAQQLYRITHRVVSVQKKIIYIYKLETSEMHVKKIGWHQT